MMSAMSATSVRTLTLKEALNEALRQEMRRDPTVILIGEDLAGGAGMKHNESSDGYGGVFGVTSNLASEFGRERVLDTPISEAGFIGAAIGAAVTGLRPVAELMFASFLGVAGDQVFNQAAKLCYMSGGKAPVPLVIRAAMVSGLQSAAQHSECNYSACVHMPGLKVVIPSTPYDAKGLLIAAIRDPDPVMFFEDAALYNSTGPVPEEMYVCPVGKADIKRDGKDLTILASGITVQHALKAAETLQKRGLSAEVIDLRWLTPLDEQTILTSLEKTKHLLIADQDYPRCSIATDLAALAVTKGFDSLDAAVQIVASGHAPYPFSPVLEQALIPNPQRIIDAAMAMF
jgi:acetoin:2,6-dichlorophenolindophenol oxidoreductase subunit beta